MITIFPAPSFAYAPVTDAASAATDIATPMNILFQSFNLVSPSSASVSASSAVTSVVFYNEKHYTYHYHYEKHCNVFDNFFIIRAF